MSLKFDKDALDLALFYRVLKGFRPGTVIENNFNDLKEIQFSISEIKGTSDSIDVSLKENNGKVDVKLYKQRYSNVNYLNCIMKKSNLFYMAFCNSILGESYSILIVENEKSHICIQLEHYFFNYKKIIKYRNDAGIICKEYEINIPCNYYSANN